MSIYKKINQLRQYFTDNPIEKKGYNKQLDYKYYLLSDIYDAVKPQLFKLDLFATVQSSIDKTYDSKNAFTLDYVLSISDISKTEVSDKVNNSIHEKNLLTLNPEKITFSLSSKFNRPDERFNEDQLTGRMTTYMTKYLWINALMLSDGDFDADKFIGSPVKELKRPVPANLVMNTKEDNK